MKQFGFQASEEDVAAMMQSIDKDKNGTIELEEFLAFLTRETAQSLGPRDEKAEMLRVFRLFDKDGNGQISREELLEGLNHLGEAMSEKEVL